MTAPQVYISFPGTARDALGFYAGVFGGELSLYTNEDFGVTNGALMPPPTECSAALLHWRGSDTPEGGKSIRFEGLMLALLGTVEPAVLHEWFDKLAEGGRVVDALAPKPWGASDGQVADRYGLHWLIGYEAEPEPAGPGAQGS
jgi:PhnB protein